MLLSGKVPGSQFEFLGQLVTAVPEWFLRGDIPKGLDENDECDVVQPVEAPRYLGDLVSEWPITSPSSISMVAGLQCST